MKTSFEGREPLNIKEAQEMLDMFAQAGIDPPQNIKEIIMHSAGRGFATSEERRELSEYLETLKGGEHESGGSERNS